MHLKAEIVDINKLIDNAKFDAQRGFAANLQKCYLYFKVSAVNLVLLYFVTFVKN